MQRSRTWLALGAVAVGALILVAAGSVLWGPGRKARRGDRPHTVLFVVLDTVRSQSTELCGYARPNTPNLVALRERGAAVACDAYAPGSWTLPSHVSYFSGLSVPEHEVHGPRPFPDEVPTLAERMKKRGYRTAMVASNRVLRKKSGLQRGFDHARVSKHKGSSEGTLVGEKLPRAVAEMLKRFDPREPLFLFVNIFDAHDPYPDIPAGVDWVKPQEKVFLHSAGHGEFTPFNRYVTGRMKGAQADGYIRRIRNGYDYGIFHADRSLGRVLEVLEDAGRFDRPYRLVVVSDHGEMIGEHTSLRHGGAIYEELQRVPLVFYDSRGDQPTLPSPVSAIHAYHLALHGALPDEPIRPNAVSVHVAGPRETANQAGLWFENGEKQLFSNGRYLRFDLNEDPREQAPARLPDPDPDSEIARFADAFLTMRSKESEVDPELADLLERLGYATAEE